MKTKIIKADQLKQAAQLIRQGELVAFPTETVYGLGADATNEEAVKKVYQAKGRPSDNPLIVHVNSINMVEKYVGELNTDSRKLIEKFWPGSLTLIFKIKPNALSKTVTGGLDTAAFRFPKNQLTLDLIQLAEKPLVGPSANTSGKPSPTSPEHVYHDLNDKIAGILDDGSTKVGVESTVLDMSVDTPTILRPGAVTKRDLEEVLGKEVNDEFHHVGISETPKAPGMKYKHYAPNAQVYIVKPEDNWDDVIKWIKNNYQKPVGIMAFDQDIANFKWPENVMLKSLGSDVNSASRLLFKLLRDFDSQPEFEIIFTQGVVSKDLGEAYMNRLNKSAGKMYFDQL
ncbi:L-threonylcarbamoyladenylate synthase [Lentilactobacillus laojiaonis]|uniref:L-threonylcarbamoyladenylate synthase n=1 Tax=Lentilactobacillus laojiaonis TaxID=2883998 RepID=UPI001D09B226|nr:L-threonylcarbamoyladenylate synthase [Lentilactobacillus laojiaonis]UDM31764.1 threonylcarbamoyl-AMP synthase [Lentilactobacillus laojiaonis]